MKILVVRFSSIGDIVLTSPVLRCIKQQMPGIELHFLCKKQFRMLVEPNLYVDKVYSIEKKLSELIPELKRERYDYLIDLHHNFRTLQLKTMLGVKSLCFDKLNYKKWLRVNLKVDQLPRVHIVDRYLETVKSLGIENDRRGLDYFIPEKDQVEVGKEFPQLVAGFYALVAGGSYATKQIPLSKLREICRLSPRPLVLLGGREDAETGRVLENEFRGKVINACGKYNLHQSASFIQQCEKVISSDTGLMHIAAAFKKDIVSLWGNTIPEFGMYPYRPGDGSKILEVKNLSCRPCSKLGYKKCPKGHFKCMNEIDVQQVF